MEKHPHRFRRLAKPADRGSREESAAAKRVPKPGPLGFAVLLIGLVVWSLSVEPRSRPQNYAAISARARWGYTLLWGALLAISVLGCVTFGACAI